MSPKLTHPVNSTTAQFPGLELHACIARLMAGTSEPALGAIGTAHAQICPQTPGHLDEATCEELRAAHPSTQFRTHANARVRTRLAIEDLSTVSSDTLPFFRELADRNRRLGARVTSLHAGYRANATLDQMLDNCRRLQDEVFGDATTLAIEGLYPHKRRPQLVDSWNDYERLLRDGYALALDLSHLLIVAAADGAPNHDLVRALCEHAVEIHLSTNDTRSDAHQWLHDAPWWWPVLCRAELRDDCVIFTEGRQPDPFRIRQEQSA